MLHSVIMASPAGEQDGGSAAARLPN
jgi:hypothetical protein